MAKQKSIIKLKGTLSDITFYKSQDGYMAREKGGLDGDRIRTEERFARTRENMAEFSRGGKAAKLFRTAFQGLLIHAKDSRMTSRLMRRMMAVLKTDTIHDRGLRTIVDGNTELLAGFECNIRGKLGTCFYAPYTTAIDRAAGTLSVDIPSFIPANMVAVPQGSTHYKISSAAAEVDFETETYVMSSSETDILPWDAAPSTVISHTNSVTAASTKPLFLVVGIQFYQQVNAQMYPLKNGAYNPLAVVAASHN